MRPPLVVSLLLAFVAGCQSTAPLTSLSYVEPIPSVHAAELGSAIATYVAGVWPGAQTTLILIPPDKTQAVNEVTTALTAGLLHSGFALSAPQMASTTGTHRLQYWVTALDGNALVRLSLDGAPVARLYSHDDKGGLMAASPVTVRN